MLAVADDDFLDFLERAGIDADAARGHRFAAVGAVFGEFDRLAVFDQQDFLGHRANRVRQGGVAEELPVFSVNRNEVARAHEVQEHFLLFLAGVAGNVDRAAVIVVIDQGALAEHVVQHAEDGFFIAGNDARGEDHGVALVEREQAVIIHGDARERRHGLGLAAADQHHQFFRRERIDVLRAHHQAVGNAQAVHAVRDLDVIDHAAADESDFAADGGGDVHDLLDARDRRCEAGDDHFARRRAREFLDARADGPLRRRVAGALDVGAVAEQREHAFRAVAREGVQVKRLAVDRRRVHLEIAGVNDDSDRSANGERDAVNRAVRDADELDFERRRLPACVPGITSRRSVLSSRPCSSRRLCTSASVKRVP